MSVQISKIGTEISSADELIVFVDDAGTPIGTGPKADSHHADTRLHLAFSVFLFNSKGELLLQQRALHKKTWPGVWSNSCCGHLLPGERTEDAAARRLEFELGLKNIDLTIALPDFRYRAELDGVVENEICPVLVGFTDAEPQPNPEEVNAAKWMPWGEVLQSVADPRSELSPWAIEEVQLLAQSVVLNSDLCLNGEY
jgi:isopentenyl-diphosphate delta-isomerase